MTDGFAKRLLVRLLLTIFLTFTILGTVGSGYVGYLLSSPHVLTQQLKAQSVAEKVYDSVEKYVTDQYQTTAIPPETYLDVITEDWITEQITAQITAEYATLKGNETTYQMDTTALDDAITTFFSDYAAEIDYTPDDTYDEKLQETIDRIHTELETQLDVYHFTTMQDANILSKLTGKQTYLWIACGGCAVVSIFLILLLYRLEKQGEWGRLYFSGCALLVDGLFLSVPSIWILATSYFNGLAVKIPAVYAAFTGVLYHCTKVALVGGIVCIVLGLAAMIGSVLRNRKKIA